MCSRASHITFDYFAFQTLCVLLATAGSPSGRESFQPSSAFGASSRMQRDTPPKRMTLPWRHHATSANFASAARCPEVAASRMIIQNQAAMAGLVFYLSRLRDFPRAERRSVCKYHRQPSRTPITALSSLCPSLYFIYFFRKVRGKGKQQSLFFSFFRPHCYTEKITSATTLTTLRTLIASTLSTLRALIASTLTTLRALWPVPSLF